MNSVQVQPVAGSASAASAATASASATGSGRTNGVSVFAALVAELLGGEAAANGQGTPILGEMQPDALQEMTPAEQDAADPQTPEEILEQLAAWIAGLSPELVKKLTEQPEVAEWMALANAELAMSGTDPIASLSGETARTYTRDEPANPLAGLLERLTAALRLQPDQPYLLAAAEQAKPVLANAMLAAAAAAEPIVTDASANGAERTIRTGTESGKAAVTDIIALLRKANGQMQSANVQTTDASAADKRMSHLNAMQAKTALIHTASSASTAAAAETGANHPHAATSGSDMPQLTIAGQDVVKAGWSETAIKVEGMPAKVPLSNAAQHLADWIVKQASGRGSLKAETVIKLMPEHLGQVEVKLSMQNGQLSATITADSAAAKDALESNLAALRMNLQSQGVSVERLVVSQQQPSGFQSGMFQDGRQQRQSSGREPDRDQQSRKDRAAEEWQDALRVNFGQDQTDLEAYGSSFRAEA